MYNQGTLIKSGGSGTSAILATFHNAGIFEIQPAVRETDSRATLAVTSRERTVDPVGACVGMRGMRIQNIVRELSDEKIDVIEWNVDSAQFIAKALSPARVSDMLLEDDLDTGRTATVIVPDDQLSLAIGREGQNARLAAKLTGWRIDIKSEEEKRREVEVDMERGRIGRTPLAHPGGDREKPAEQTGAHQHEDACRLGGIFDAGVGGLDDLFDGVQAVVLTDNTFLEPVAEMEHGIDLIGQVAKAGAEDEAEGGVEGGFCS